MNIDIEALKRIAQAATPGPWIYDTGYFYAQCQLDGDGKTREMPIIEMGEGRGEDCIANEEFIANAHPAVVLELIALLERHLAMKWQPIETAPKDGTSIILRCGSRVTVGDWISPEMVPNWEGDDFEAHWQSWDGGFIANSEHDATQWMPLPEPTEV